MSLIALVSGQTSKKLGLVMRKNRHALVHLWHTCPDIVVLGLGIQQGILAFIHFART